MIVVTGAAGKTGQAVVKALASRGVPTRAVVRRSGHEQHVRAAGAGDVQVGDLRDGAAMAIACRDASAIYHICPNVSPDEVAIGRVVIDAACRAGVERFVFHSVLHPQLEAMPHHWRKMRVEEMLLASGLTFTILQPTAYMQNLLAHRRSILDRGVLPAPYRPEAAISLVDLEDVATVAATVLVEDGHDGATYALCGTAPMTQHAVAKTLGTVAGRDLRAVELSEAGWVDANAALDVDRREALLAMFRFYDRHGLAGNPRVLRWLLGRTPTSLRDFAERAFGRRGRGGGSVTIKSNRGGRHGR